MSITMMLKLMMMMMMMHSGGATAVLDPCSGMATAAGVHSGRATAGTLWAQRSGDRRAECPQRWGDRRRMVCTADCLQRYGDRRNIVYTTVWRPPCCMPATVRRPPRHINDDGGDDDGDRDDSDAAVPMPMTTVHSSLAVNCPTQLRRYDRTGTPRLPTMLRKSSSSAPRPRL